MTRDDARSDAELVSAYLTGDGDALGALYDRFGAGLYDTAAAMLRDRDAAADVVQDVFCIAATKLGQLREPERVKPWLYAVARHEIYRRTRARKRDGTSLDAMIADRAGDEPVSRYDPDAEGAAVMSAELASTVRAAAAGLDASDQLVLELSARQGLAGADLAAAMGVSAGQAHSMLFRMRERLERAVGAIVVTRAGREHCADLAVVLAGWDGTFDVLWRKRIARHIDGCDSCQTTRRGAAVLSLAGAAPAFAAPIGLRERTIEAANQAAGGAAGDTPRGDGGGRAGPATDSGRYSYDGDGFPAGIAGSNRSLLAPLLAVLTAVFAIVLGLVAFNRAGVDGAVAAGFAAPVTSSSTTTTSTTTTTTTTTTSTTTTTTTPATTTTATTATTATPAPAAPAPPPTVPPAQPPTRRPAQPPTVPATAPPTRPTTATTPPSTAAPAGTPTQPPRTTAATTTPTTRPLVIVAVTTTTTQPPLRLVMPTPTTTTSPPVP